MTVRDVDLPDFEVTPLEREAGEYAANTQMRRYPNQHACDECKIRNDIKTDYLAGYASGQKSRWLAYPENYPNKRGDYFVLYEGRRPSVLRWFSEERWEDGQKPTHFLLIELPDQSVSKEGE